MKRFPHPQLDQRLWAIAAIVCGVVTATAGCSPEFPPYAEVNGLRVLAVRASHPHLPPEGEVTMDALIHSEPGEGELRYSWSWCPFSTGGASGFECAISYEELQSAINENAPVPFTLPPYDLGSSNTATLGYPAPPLFLQATCASLLSQDLPDFIEVPSCDEGFPIQIKLVVEQGSSRVEAVKEVKLVYVDGEERNTNPTLEDLAMSSPAFRSGTLVHLPEEGNATLARDLEFEMRVEFEESIIETFTPEATEREPSPAPARESLAITWFVQGGDTGSKRTGFIEDVTGLDEAKINTWRTPRAEDYPEPTMKVYAVIRDNRGGVGWLAREVALE